VRNHADTVLAAEAHQPGNLFDRSRYNHRERAALIELSVIRQERSDVARIAQDLVRSEYFVEFNRH
jgi:hypothetical protein